MPITDEVGGEGGSFADATLQEGAFSSELEGGIPRSDRGHDLLRGAERDEDVVDHVPEENAPNPRKEMRKYPTE